MLLPPICYILSIYYLESFFAQRYSSGVESIYISDSESLLNGSMRLEEHIERNVEQYVQTLLAVRMGVKIEVGVTTNYGKIIYPPFYEKSEKFVTSNPIVIAADNYELMSEGINLKVGVTLGHNTFLSNSLLLAYITVFSWIFYFHYRSGVIKARREEHDTAIEIDRFLDREADYSKKLETLEEKRKRLLSDLAETRERLETEKSRAFKTEEDFIDEIVALEKKLDENLDLQGEQQELIKSLVDTKSDLGKKDLKESKQRRKTTESIQKRFGTLYKQTVFNKRALSGYLNLPEDLSLKCEETIHNLNEDAESVTIKRKVFGKKGSETVLEVVFGYKGRLYYRKIHDNLNEVLAIGTKNTQAKDLEFLNKL
jgi:hypothetical protein